MHCSVNVFDGVPLNFVAFAVRCIRELQAEQILPVANTLLSMNSSSSYVHTYPVEETLRATTRAGYMLGLDCVENLGVRAIHR